MKIALMVVGGLGLVAFAVKEFPALRRELKIMSM